jgi:hypothetical protein
MIDQIHYSAVLQAHKAYLEGTEHRTASFRSLTKSDAAAAHVIEQRMKKLMKLQVGAASLIWPKRDRHPGPYPRTWQCCSAAIAAVVWLLLCRRPMARMIGVVACTAPNFVDRGVECSDIVLQCRL